MDAWILVTLWLWLLTRVSSALGDCKWSCGMARRVKQLLLSLSLCLSVCVRVCCVCVGEINGFHAIFMHPLLSRCMFSGVSWFYMCLYLYICEGLN